MEEKDEIKDFLEMNMDVDTDKVVDYVFNLYQEKEKYKSALETSRLLLDNTISKERYNDLVKKYNKEVKKR